MPMVAALLRHPRVNADIADFTGKKPAAIAQHRSYAEVALLPSNSPRGNSLLLWILLVRCVYDFLESIPSIAC
jgi:hypothetical protein